MKDTNILENDIFTLKLENIKDILLKVCQDIENKYNIHFLYNSYIQKVNAITWVFYFCCSLDENEFNIKENEFENFDENFSFASFKSYCIRLINQVLKSNLHSMLRYYSTNLDILNYYKKDKYFVINDNEDTKETIVNFDNVNFYNFGVFPDNDYNVFSTFFQVTEE